MEQNKMDLKKTFFVLILYMYLNYIEAFKNPVCFNDKTGVYECCQDYRNVSGKCEACIGSWGVECRNNCTRGFYGHGCRSRCSCSYKQTCDPKQGCIKSLEAPLSTTPNADLGGFTTIKDSLLVVSGFLILLLLCTILICNRKMRKQSKPIKTYADGQEVIYNDIRDFQIVDNSSVTSTRVCNLHPNLNGVITPVETKKPSNQARIPLTRSKTLDPEGYGIWCKGSDNYNHINFKSEKHLSSYSNVMTNDYDVFKSPRTSPETQINDNNCDENQQCKEETFEEIERIVHPIRNKRSMVNRPYSSVKCNRTLNF
ncbi:multiple epidermal growth factor-like domains protein 10 [Crassostrea angulata]|uniref:multiple epidermal growth factor-like domains protein 10 n=1 Tax=Magallana angulata TaxID=2784310 RepID=UPI0022B198AF|nr:multiple epidermal growth factor-like domains protein 10 [Crassostrea angulata]